MRLVAQLIIRLVAIALLCLAATCAFTMQSAHRAVETQTVVSAERVAHELENLFWREILWRESMRRDKILPIPNWRSLSTMAQISPGVCISFALPNEPPESLCSQLEGLGAQPPRWFERLYATLFGPPAPVTRPLTVRQPQTGAVTARANPDAAMRQAYSQISLIVSVAAAMAMAICALSAAAVAQALAPTQTIVEGLRRLETGDYARPIVTSARAEFAVIARAANDLGARLAQTTAARAALTKRLFEVQEDERRALARDLHDEFGQCLTAILAFAAAIEAGAAERADLADDARAITRVTSRMMTTLRETLARLRSQDLEDLGLEACLAQLVASWNARQGAGAIVRLDVAGDLSRAPPAVAVNLYRIAQECLTNAMRHGAPTDVRLRLALEGGANGGIALCVEDDGGGDPERLRASTGHGILGVRERIAAFGGSLSINRAARGVRVAAHIPFSLAA